MDAGAARKGEDAGVARKGTGAIVGMCVEDEEGNEGVATSEGA